MDQILAGSARRLAGFFGSPVVQFVIYCDRGLPGRPLARQRLLGLPRHAAADRERDPAVPRGEPRSSCFTPDLLPLAIFVYKIIRPHEKIGEVYERNLAEEALLAEVEAIKSCPTCARRVNDEWIICPTCRTRLNRVCPNCCRLVGLDWSLCAWCGKDFERPAPRRSRRRPAGPRRSRRCRPATRRGRIGRVRRSSRPRAIATANRAPSRPSRAPGLVAARLAPRTAPDVLPEG